MAARERHGLSRDARSALQGFDLLASQGLGRPAHRPAMRRRHYPRATTPALSS
jgi:hypothetical protein